MISLEGIKEKTGKQIALFCQVLVEFGKVYHDEEMPFYDEFHPMNYYLENLLNTYKVNNIDAVLRDLGISTRYACQFRPDKVYGGHGIPPRIIYDKFEKNNAVALEDISDEAAMRQYLEEFCSYAKNFFQFMEKMQEKIQQSFSRNKEAQLLYNLAATYKPQVRGIVEKLIALEAIV